MTECVFLSFCQPMYSSASTSFLRRYGTAADMFSFGILLLEISTYYLEKAHLTEVYQLGLKLGAKPVEVVFSAGIDVSAGYLIKGVMTRIAEGWRPQFSRFLWKRWPRVVELIRKLWKDDAKMRPNVDEVLKEIKEISSFSRGNEDEGLALGLVDYDYNVISNYCSGSQSHESDRKWIQNDDLSGAGIKVSPSWLPEAWVGKMDTLPRFHARNSFPPTCPYLKVFERQTVSEQAEAQSLSASFKDIVKEVSSKVKKGHVLRIVMDVQAGVSEFFSVYNKVAGEKVS